MALRYGLLLKLKPVSRVTLSASRESLQAVVHRSLQVLKLAAERWQRPSLHSAAAASNAGRI